MRVASPPGRRFQKLLWLTLLASLSACQHLFGDFSEEPVSVIDGSGGQQGMPEACTEGAVSCEGATLLVCSGGFWGAKGQCDSPELCDSSGLGRCLVCVEGDFECVDSENSRRCEDGDWVDQPACTGKLRCDETVERCIACDPGDRVCDGDVLCTCLKDQTGWDKRTCLVGCEPAGLNDHCIDDVAMLGAPATACSGI